jgi:hypothetical protein
MVGEYGIPTRLLAFIDTRAIITVVGGAFAEVNEVGSGK